MKIIHVLAGALALACVSAPALAAIDPAGPSLVSEAALHPNGGPLQSPFRRLRNRKPVVSEYAAAGGLR